MQNVYTALHFLFPSAVMAGSRLPRHRRQADGFTAICMRCGLIRKTLRKCTWQRMAVYTCRLTEVITGRSLTTFPYHNFITCSLMMKFLTTFMADYRTTAHGWGHRKVLTALKTATGKMLAVETVFGFSPTGQTKIQSIPNRREEKHSVTTGK